MKRPSIFRLPIFWLFLGPPIVRLQAHGAMDSLQGNYDFWNFFQSAWWLLGGAVALRELYLNRAWLREFVHGMGSLSLWTGLWLLALYLSCLVSPAPLFSFAKVTLVGALILAAADLGVKVYAGIVPVRRILKILLVSSVLLLLGVGFFYMYKPDLVTNNYAEIQHGLDLRMRGGRIAYTPIVSTVALMLGLYFFLTTPGLTRWLHVLIVSMSLLFLLLGRTRSAYVGFIAGLALFVWRWKRMDQNITNLMTAAALGTAVVCVTALTYDWSGSLAQDYNAVFGYIIRETESLSTMTGRTQVMTALWDEIARRPLGLGFSAGPRAFLMSDSFVEAMHTDAFGNTHNAYLEVLAGSGYLGFMAWMAIVLYVLNVARKMRQTDLIPLAALLIAALLEGITESLLVEPFYQTAVLFWIVAAVAAAYRARRSLEASAHPSYPPAYAS